MRLGIIAFLCGNLIFLSLHELPDPNWSWWVLAAAVSLFVCVPRLQLFVWVSAGFCWALFSVTPAQMQLPSTLEGIDLRVTGWIVDIPTPFYRGTRFYLDVESLSHGNKTIPFKGQLRLSWYEDNGISSSLRSGDHWAFTVRLKRPRGLVNPGGFDYERWLYVNRIYASGYVRALPAPERIEPVSRYTLDRFRQRMAEQTQRLLPHNPYSGILTALAVGERRDIVQEQWDVFTRTGTSHLLAISGLHIGLVAGIGFSLFQWAWSRFKVTMCVWPASKVGALGAVVSAGSYALLAGLSLPTQRALIMISVTVLALLWQRPIVPSRVLTLALFLVLLIDPVAPLTGGFWLSFGAVATILYCLVGRWSENPLLRKWLVLQVSITLALLPITLMLFQSVSLVAPIANLVAIPWVSMTIVPLTLLAVAVGFVSEVGQEKLLELAAFAMDGLWRFLCLLGDQSWALHYAPAPPVWVLAFALPGLLLLLAPRGLPKRWLGAVLCLPLMFGVAGGPSGSGFWFTLLDVGQGLAAVVRTRDHVLVYDTGPRLGARLDAGQIALIPYLRQQGIRYVDVLVLSHADIQHTGGVRSLLEEFEVKKVLTASLLEVPVENAETCRAGDGWLWNGVQFQFLHPPVGDGFFGDDASCVLHIAGPDGRVLLPGDIGPSAELALLETYGSALAAEVLVAPKQGSSSQSLPAFIEAVNPKYVLFSINYKNRFGFPRPETQALFESAGAQLLNTSEQGAISFRIDREPFSQPQAYREQSRRFWRVSSRESNRF